MANGTLLPGIAIGKYAMVGVGAVVTKDVPDYGVVVGAPAKVVRHIKKYAITLLISFNYGDGFMLKNVILNKFNEALEQINVSKQYEEIADEVVLLETELDSLGFAILVTLLEEELDYDPFQMMDDAVYPKTFGEFVAIYEKYAK